MVIILIVILESYSKCTWLLLGWHLWVPLKLLVTIGKVSGRWEDPLILWASTSKMVAYRLYLLIANNEFSNAYVTFFEILRMIELTACITLINIGSWYINIDSNHCHNMIAFADFLFVRFWHILYSKRSKGVLNDKYNELFN